MKKRIFWVAVMMGLSLAGAPAVQAAPANPGAFKAAQELFEAINGEELFQQGTKAAIDKQVQGNPQYAKYRPRIEKAIAAKLPWKKLQRDLARIYARELTAADLGSITEFYKTPAGLKLAQKTLDKSVSWDKVKANPASLAGSFTPEEMTQIAAFVQTPAGAKLVAKGPELSQNTERYFDKNIKKIVEAEAQQVIAEMMSGRR